MPGLAASLVGGVVGGFGFIGYKGCFYIWNKANEPKKNVAELSCTEK